MTDDATVLAARYWSLMQTSDWLRVGELLADGFVLDWPQSGERIRGRERFVQMNAEYPAAGRWSFEVHRLVGRGAQAATEVSVSDGVRHDKAVTFFTVTDGRISHIVEYWPEAFAPAANRAHLVERTPHAAE
jgi:hypothetical protein